MSSAKWARYLRKVEVTWCPWKPKAQGLPWYQFVTSNSVKEASPKIEITKTLVAPPQSEGADMKDSTILTFADGSKETIDLTSVDVKGVVESILITNGRISTEEAKRGKPF